MSNPSEKNETVHDYRCRVCLEPIIKGAKKCLKCESYQDWRRFFQFSQIMLTLLIALISVIATSSPVIKTLFTPDRSNIKASYRICEQYNFQVILSNTGNRVAALRGGMFQVIRNGIPSEKFQVDVESADKNSDAFFINPGQSRLFSVFRKQKRPFPVKQSDSVKCEYQLKLDVVGFDHSPETPTVFCSCP